MLGDSGRHPLVNRFMALCLILVLTLAASPLPVGTCPLATPWLVLMVFGRFAIGESSASVNCALLGLLSTSPTVSQQVASVVVTGSTYIFLCKGRCSFISRLLLMFCRCTSDFFAGANVMSSASCDVYLPPRSQEHRR